MTMLSIIMILMMASSSVFAQGIVKQQDSFYFDPAPVNQGVKEGEAVTLRCDVSNRRLISFYWTLNDRPLINTTRRYQHGSDLKIEWVDRTLDNGALRCIATNTTTNIALRSAVAKLDIFWIDRIAIVELKQPKGVEDIQEGVEVILKCNVEGNPESTVEWLRNGVRLFTNDRIKISKNRLRIVSATAASENGVYSCRARNLGGQTKLQESFLLSVPGGNPELNTATFISRLVVPLGGRAVFNCQFSQAATQHWQRDENRIDVASRGGRFHMLSNGSLVIDPVDKDDPGLYQCVGVSRTGQQQTFSSQLILAYIDEMGVNTFAPTPSLPQVIPLGGKYEVQCRPPVGLPVPSIRWKNAYGVDINNQDRIRATEGLISFQNVEETDGGNYSCVAENSAGIQSRVISIVVSVGPKISRPPISSRVLEGDTATLDCKVTGTPYPVTVILWKYEDSELDMGDDRYEVDQASGLLKIRDVQSSDKGNYACFVITEGFTPVTSSNAHLYVEKKLKFNPRPDENIQMDLRQPGELACTAEGRTRPLISWTKIGQDGLGIDVEEVDGVLRFREVKSEHAGVYVCTASNDQGSINTSVKIQVIVRPQFLIRPQNVSAFVGSPAIVHCSALGDPQPVMIWDKNGRVEAIDPQRFKLFENGTLYVSDLFMEDNGKYGCSASNSGGSEREEIFIIVSPAGARGHGDKAEGLGITKTIVIATCSVLAYLAFVIALVVYCSLRLIRTRKGRKREGSNGTNGQHNLVDLGVASEKLLEAQDTNGGLAGEPSEQTELMNPTSLTLKNGGDLDNRSRVSGSSSSAHHPSHCSSTSHSTHTPPLVLPSEYDRFGGFTRNQLQTIGTLGRGHYGDVFVAKAYNLGPGVPPEVLVVVKSLLSSSSADQEEFRQEVELFGRAAHNNVARLLAISSESQPLLAVFEYCEWGNLKQYLLSAQSQSLLNASVAGIHHVSCPTAAQNFSIIQQVAIGMAHICCKLKLIHRDLAARNILLTPNLDIKVSRLALSRDMYSADYTLFNDRLIPLRWMSPESVLLTDQSERSDVWAYGVFVWETYAIGAQPLAQRTDAQILLGLRTGENRLDRPISCPPEIWRLAEACMDPTPSHRPGFTDIIMQLNHLEGRL